MTATNHALTGALIGLTFSNPWIALPAAFVSHIICDIIPHFDLADKEWTKRPSFVRYLITDASLCVLLVAILFFTQPHNWLLAAACAFVATSPDLLWIRHFRLMRANKPWVRNRVEQFFGQIQWFQRPIGAVVEVAWFLGATLLLWQFI